MENTRLLTASKISKRMTRMEFDSVYSYLQFAMRDEKESNFLLDLLTTHETYFFREKIHFKILKDYLTSEKFNDPVRVWSAACSSGEEAWSLAITLADTLQMHKQWSVLGTDVSPIVLEQARKAQYQMTRLHEIDDRLLKQYCLRGTGPCEGLLRIKPNLTSRVQFSPFNLHDPCHKFGKFNAIFMRNVLIYFDPESQQKVIERVAQQLKPGGLLFLGKGEIVRGIADLTLTGQSTWRRAS